MISVFVVRALDEMDVEVIVGTALTYRKAYNIAKARSWGLDDYEERHTGDFEPECKQHKSRRTFWKDDLYVTIDEYANGVPKFIPTGGYREDGYAHGLRRSW